MADEAKTIETLQLGQSVDSLLKTTNENFDLLQEKVDSWSDTVESGGTKGIVFESVESMINCLNSNVDEKNSVLHLNIGDEIYVLDSETPDFWVVGKVDNLSTGSAPNSWAENTTYTFGYYQIRTSKAKEVNLENFVDREEFEEGLAEAGKVQDVRVNNESVVVDKIAYINIDEIQAEKIAVEPSSWLPTTLNGNSYWAIVLSPTDTTFEVFNNNLESVITQAIEYNGYLHICVSTQPTATWYIKKIKGNAVTTGGSGSKKYLHKLGIVTYATIEDSTYDSATQIQTNRVLEFKQPFIVYAISNLSNTLSITDDFIPIFATGGLMCSEQKQSFATGETGTIIEKSNYFVSCLDIVKTDVSDTFRATVGGEIIKIENEEISSMYSVFIIDIPEVFVLNDTVTEL